MSLWLIRETIEYIVEAKDREEALEVMIDVGAEVATTDDRVRDGMTDHAYEISETQERGA